MTRAEYDERLARFRRRLWTLFRRGLFVFLPATILCVAWQIWYVRPIGLATRHGEWVIHRSSLPGYPVPPAQPLPSTRELITTWVAGMAIYVVFVAGVAWGAWRFAAAAAPKCGHCGKILMVSTRKQVLADGRCPRCQQPLF